jgi:5-methylcytosine-specific restriction endonuclease McrA
MAGFSMTRNEYRRYLRTADYDKRVRQPALERAGGRCEECGRPSPRLQVHHNDYHQVNTAEELATVRAICPRCHLRAHKPTTISDRERCNRIAPSPGERRHTLVATRMKEVQDA